MGEASDLPQVGDTINGKYRIERVLGTGGMSAVFEATHRLTGSRFALKWLRPDMAAREDAVRRFVREAKVAGRFKHPNVVEVYDFGQAGGSYYIVMELLEGESLEQRLERTGRCSPDEARRILLPCMRGVARAHAAGVIHRDIKTANIFLCKATDEQPELPKVLDFGISRITSPDVTRDSPVTESGVWMGTPQYMSPEQVRGRRVDHRTDIYGFGVVLYELLSGEVAFDAVTISDLMVKIATEHPRPLRELVPGLDPALIAITMRAMARDPAARFPDMDSMVRALQSGTVASDSGIAPALHGGAMSMQGTSLGPAPSQAVRARAPRNKLLVVALGAAALLGVLALSWLFAIQRTDSRAGSTAEPRALATAGTAAAAKVRAGAAAEHPEHAATERRDHAAIDRAPSADTPAPQQLSRPSRTREEPRHARSRPSGRPVPAGTEPAAAPEAEAAIRARGTQGRSGVRFDLQDFLPPQPAARVKTPRPADGQEAGAGRELGTTRDRL